MKCITHKCLEKQIISAAIYCSMLADIILLIKPAFSLLLLESIWKLHGGQGLSQWALGFLSNQHAGVGSPCKRSSLLWMPQFETTLERSDCFVYLFVSCIGFLLFLDWTSGDGSVCLFSGGFTVFWRPSLLPCQWVNHSAVSSTAAITSQTLCS